MVDFATHALPFRDAGIKVVFASVDSVETTAVLKQGLHVRFPILAEVDAPSAAEALGSFVQTGDRTFMHATGFLLNPDGKVDTAVYSTGPIGRLNPSEVLRTLAFRNAQS